MVLSQASQCQIVSGVLTVKIMFLLLFGTFKFPRGR